MNSIMKFWKKLTGDTIEEEDSFSVKGEEFTQGINTFKDSEQKKTLEESKIVDFSRSFSEGKGMINMKVIIVEPTVFDDVQQVANCLKENRPVLVNFERTESSIARRIVDFISGTTYALSGEIKKVGHNVYLCVPNNVNVSYTDELQKSKAVEFPWMKK